MTQTLDSRSPPLAGLDSLELDGQASRLIRDMYALATLPAMWMGAEPVRIIQSLLDALEATVRPEFCYFRSALEPAGDAQQVIELAHLDGTLAPPEKAVALGAYILNWIDTHDPAELMNVDVALVGRPARAWVHPLELDPRRGVLAAGFRDGPSDTERMLLNLGATQASVACRNAILQAQADSAREEAQALHSVARMLAAELDLEEVVQKTTDAARQLTGAAFTAFFQNRSGEDGEQYMLYTLSGAPREAFESFAMPRNSPLFEPTFRGTHVVRVDDVLRHPQCGTLPPHYGMPKGHLAVRSYLAVPVTARSGEVYGGLFFGHPEPGVFSERAERIATGIARQAAVAIDNARLFRRAEDEIRQRRRAEEALRRDIDERERAEQALRESEERYRRLVELLPVAVYTCAAPDGVITYFNDVAVEAWGRAPAAGDSDARFCGSMRLYLPDGTHLPHEDCPMARALREGRAYRSEEVMIERADGSRITVLVNIDPIYDADGSILGAINVFHDVSAYKRAERALREQKENLETLLETVPVGVLIAHDPECRRIVGNRAATELLRMSEGANLSKSAPPAEIPPHFRVLQSGRVLPSRALPVQRAASGEIVEQEELDHEFDDGTVVHTIISARPLYDAAGEPRGAVASLLDITSLKNAEWALREADRRKDEFLATLAHELRNPLAPVRTSLELMQRAKGDEETLEACRSTIERQVNHLVRLVDDLLDVSRITRDRLELRRSRVELAEILRQAVETCKPLVDREAHVLEVDLPETPVYLDVDPVRIAQVFSNLLNNACKYTPHKGSIRLAARRDADRVLVSVTDDGIGIPAAEMSGIFDMFAQVDDAHERSRGGLGIGLTLARRLVEMHGGQISGRSDGVGRGSEFTVTLPVLPDGSEPVEVGDEPGPPATPLRILVVDDNRDAADMLATLLSLNGHETHLAYDGKQAVEAAENWAPDVILLDLGLPVLDGVEACRIIRAAPWGKRTVIVALSGWGQEGDRRKTREAGFDEHLIKPVDHAVLSALLGPLVGR